jgi:hypothetical protein
VLAETQLSELLATKRDSRLRRRPQWAPPRLAAFQLNSPITSDQLAVIEP